MIATAYYKMILTLAENCLRASDVASWACRRQLDVAQRMRPAPE